MSNSRRGFRSKGRRDQRDESVESIPVRSARSDNRDRRAYNHQQSKVTNWADSRDFEQRPKKDKKGGKSTARTQKWQQKNKAPKEVREEPIPPKPDFSAKVEVPATEPKYDVGAYTASIPVIDIYGQNFDHSGFVDLCYSVYEQLTGYDNRLPRSMPYSGFLHCMATILNAHLLDSDRANGRHHIDIDDYISDMFGPEFVMPSALHDYLECLGTVNNADGDKIKMNLPDVCIPNGPYELVTSVRAATQPDDGTTVYTDAIVNIPSGTFGIASATDHNKYEVSISPYVTSMRVIASREKNQNWMPLPNGLFPAGCVPNQNLLGYGPPDVLSPEGIARISGFDFPDSEDAVGRLRHSAELFQRVQTTLRTFEDKIDLKVVSQIKGRNMTRIEPRVTLSNVEFVEVTKCDVTRKVSLFNPNVYSCQAFGRSLASQAAILTLHRRR